MTPRDPPCVHLFGCDEAKPQHILGIDGNGRDQFSRLVFGARVSLVAGLGAVTFAVVIGTVARACWPASSAGGSTTASCG